MALDIIRSGWIEKEVKSLQLFKVFKKRFLVLDKTSLSYYHEEVKFKPKDVEGIPLNSIIDFELLKTKESTNDPQGVLFRLTSSERSIVFRVPREDDYRQWKKDIMEAKSQFQLHSASQISHIYRRIRPSVNQLDDIVIIGDEAGEWLRQFEFSVTSTIERIRDSVNLFFDCVESLNPSEKRTRSKEMGKALVVWLDDNVDDEVMGKKDIDTRYSRLEVLRVWMDVTLSRELKSSCKYDTGPNVNESNGSISEFDKNLTPEELEKKQKYQSKRKSIQAGGTKIMPFRADTPECLFISSVVHWSSVKHRLFYQLLRPLLFPISQKPQDFSYPKKNMPNINLTPIPQKDPPKKRSSFMFRRSVNHTANSNNTSNNNITAAETGPATGGNRRSSIRWLMKTVGFDGEQNNSSSNDLNALREIDEKQKNIDFEERRHEISENLHELARKILKRLLFLQETTPFVVKTVIQTIKEITLERSIGIDANVSNHQNEELYRYGTFFTACTAVLFLRLISGAVISPDIHGVMQDFQHSVNPVISGKGKLNSGNSDSDSESAPPVKKSDTFNELPIRIKDKSLKSEMSSEREIKVKSVAVRVPSEESMTSEVEKSNKHVFSAHGVPAFILFSQTIVESLAMKEEPRSPVPSARVTSVSAVTVSEENEDFEEILNNSGDWKLKVLEKSKRIANCFTVVDATRLTAEYFKRIELRPGPSLYSPKSPPPESPNLPPDHAISKLDEPIDSGSEKVTSTKNIDLGINERESNSEGEELKEDYNLDMVNPVTRWALAEVASTLQKIANISCLPKDQTHSFARENIIRQNIAAGITKKEDFENYQFKYEELKTVETQLELSDLIKQFYVYLGELPSELSW